MSAREEKLTDPQRIQATLLAAKKERDAAIEKNQNILKQIPEGGNISGPEQALDEAKKKPTSISLVKAFLLCNPNTRSRKSFANTLVEGLENQSFRIKWLRGSPIDLKQALKDDWIDYCMKPGNEHLPESSPHEISMGFIGMILSSRRYSAMKVSLPPSTERNDKAPKPT